MRQHEQVEVKPSPERGASFALNMAQPSPASASAKSCWITGPAHSRNSVASGPTLETMAAAVVARGVSDRGPRKTNYEFAFDLESDPRGRKGKDKVGGARLQAQGVYLL